MERITGRYTECTVVDESFKAFVPAELPPEPPLQLDGNLLLWLEKANRAIGRLDGLCDVLPDSQLFLYQYVRKEALLSSQIEGTQSSFSDLLIYELKEVPGIPVDDVEEVSNYVAAMEHGIQRMENGFPLSLRLLREIHGILLQGGRGSTKSPGEFRRSQNWIGGSRPGNAKFVPPPPHEMQDCLTQLEQYLHDQHSTSPVLIKAALAHLQFETIHPFLDGNGRLGRLLITLILIHEKVLRRPLLYLSLHLKQNRNQYYDHLQNVRIKGDWESWLEFFLRGIYETATQAVATARSLLALFENDRTKIRGLGRISGSCLELHEHLQQSPITNLNTATRALSVTKATTGKCIAKLQELGMLVEITGYKRNRLFVYEAYTKKLSEATEPL